MPTLTGGDFPSYGSTLAAAFFVLALRRVGKGCAPSWSYPQNFESENQSGGRSHYTDYTSPCDALEYANHGKSSRLKRSDDTSDMEATQPEAASGQKLQTQPRQALCRKVVRHRWIVSESPGQIAGSLRGRKESNPGSEQDPARSAAKERPVRNDDPRLPTKWHDHLVCGLKYAGRQSYRRLHAASSTPGVYPFPQANRWRNPLRTGSSFDCRQLRHPRFHLHFTPTSSSWLNLVERWFCEITDKRIRRGSFQNVSALVKAIKDYLENHNQNPKIFVWSAPVERILAKIAKCKEVLDALH